MCFVQHDLYLMLSWFTRYPKKGLIDPIGGVIHTMGEMVGFVDAEPG